MAKPPPSKDKPGTASGAAEKSKGKPTASKGKSEDKGALHAPLEMRSRTHEEAALDTQGANDAKALHRKRKKRSQLRKMATLSALPIGVLVVLGIYASLWFSTASAIEDLARDGFPIEHGEDQWQVKTKGDIHVGGFPLVVHGTLDAVTITAPNRWGGWQWTTERLVLEGKPWGRHDILLRPEGAGTLLLADGQTYRTSFNELSALLRLEKDNAIQGVTVTAKNMTIQPPAGAAPAVIGSLLAEGKAIPIIGQADSHTPTYEGSLTLSQTTLPPDMAPPIGTTLNLLEIRGKLLGLFDGQSLREKMGKWRDAGGVAEVEHFYLDWAPLRMAAAGTLALDDQMQPVGALSSQIQGFLEAAEGLYKGKVMRARDLTLARVVLGSMAEDKGGVLTLTTPVSLQGGKVLLGPVTVMDLPTIAWPGPASPRELPSLRPNYQVDRWGNVSRQD